MCIKFYSLIFLWIIVVLISFRLGHYNVGYRDILTVFIGGGNSTLQNVIFQIRLPRILISSLCGGILAICGIYLQALFKNPIVDQKIIGVSTGAAFGGCIAILLGLNSVHLIGFAFGFSLIALSLLFFISSFVKEFSILTLILAGVVVNGFFGALIGLVQFCSDNEDILPNIVFWLMGSFSSANYQKLYLLVIVAIPIIAILYMSRWNLNILSQDEESLKNNGIKVKKIRIFILACVTLLIATQVSISGNIGWIGLVVPHMIRLMVGASHLKSVPCSFVFGMSFMLIVDTISRTITSVEIPLSIITALIGAPLFVLLLKKGVARNKNA